MKKYSTYILSFKLEASDKVNVTLEKNGLFISKTGPTLEDLLKGYTALNRHEEHFKKSFDDESI